MKTSVIIINYNSGELLKNCLSSLTSQKKFVNRIIVVDNSSKDESLKNAIKHYPDITYLKNNKNYGYSHAINQAASLINDKYILILNPDIEVLPDSIKNMADFMEKTPDAGIAAPMLYYPDGQLQHSCRRFYDLKTLFFRRVGILQKIFPEKYNEINRLHEMIDIDRSRPAKVDWVLGAGFMIRNEIFKKIGMMDEKFFLYFEDVDICKRIKKAGLFTYYLPSAKMTHIHIRSSAGTMFNMAKIYHFKSMIKYIKKHGLS